MTQEASRAGDSFVLLDDSSSQAGATLLFEAPRDIISCHDPAEAEESIRRLSEASKEGYHLAGFFAYELGYLLEPKLQPLLPPNRRQPLIWMGLFDAPRRLSESETRSWLSDRGGDKPPKIDDLTLSWDRDAYLEAYERVQEYILAGDVYQINLTFSYLFKYFGDPIDFYKELRHKQRVSHGGMVAAEDFTILSLSPELFLDVKDGQVKTRPMKGTARRGRTPAEDDALADWLAADPKSRAENLMIVDLLRNDLGRSALIGSVQVTDLFSVERYATVLQMTSGITARLHPGVGLGEILRALFPCGSVTGAPKVRAMEIIRELETRPRGVYTGSLGMIAPNGDLSFNVAIRSLWLENDGRGEMGIGSGVVYDSEGPAEFDECLLKAAFLTDPYEPFSLIETLRWQTSDGYWLLERHLERLEGSARHFLYPFDRQAVIGALEKAARDFTGDCFRVRLTLDADGVIEVTATAITLPTAGSLFRYALSDRQSNSANPFLYHKTTRRQFYEQEQARWRDSHGCDEVIFLNERGELTEGCRTNLYIEKDERLFTPPLEAGVLDGTLRRQLLSNPARWVVEKTLYLEDLEAADAVYLGNSVRGLLRAERVV